MRFARPCCAIQSARTEISWRVERSCEMAARDRGEQASIAVGLAEHAYHYSISARHDRESLQQPSSGSLLNTVQHVGKGSPGRHCWLSGP